MADRQPPAILTHHTRHEIEARGLGSPQSARAVGELIGAIRHGPHEQGHFYPRLSDRLDQRRLVLGRKLLARLARIFVDVHRCEPEEARRQVIDHRRSIRRWMNRHGVRLVSITSAMRADTYRVVSVFMGRKRPSPPLSLYSIANTPAMELRAKGQTERAWARIDEDFWGNAPRLDCGSVS